MFEKIEYSPIGKSNIRTLFELLKSDRIDKTPDYQRFGKIWSKEKKQLLIDSIINGYDIPKIYFHYLVSASRELNQSNKLLAIIDGKQRIEAVEEFLNNQLRISQDFVLLKDEEIDLKGATFEQIELKYPWIADDILNYQFDFVFIETDERERIDELFLRLNEGVPLNNSERRKSYGGFLVQYALQKIEELDFFTFKVSFSNKRLEHFDLYTKLALIETSEDLKSFTKTTLDKLIKDNKLHNAEIQNNLDRLNQNLNELSTLFEERDELLRSKSLVPLYYLFFIKEDNDNEQMKLDFLRQFHERRKTNRKDLPYDKINQIMIEFDRLTQQGANQKKSLEKRLLMLDRYYQIFLKYGSITVETKISTAGLDMKKMSYSNDI
ncbi:MAG: DUF262 domain-containing protein [Bacteroidales bacterium]|nr:DUF262 domain-containing protein [Bacteroidales bacterium]